MYYVLPILYLNMGVEMLYILQQRLYSQRICPEKTIQVMNEVIHAFLDLKQLQKIFNDKSSVPNLLSTRTILERVVLSSIVKLDVSSMSKLFDLMIMMLKYQMDTATGPREVILLTLNHVDAVRNMAVDKTLNVDIDHAHRLILDTFGNMKHKAIWQIRNECLREVKGYSIQVSILLKLGMQNQDTTFNRLPQRYNERYQERREVLENIKLLDLSDDESSIGSLSLFGNRVTVLGKNLYLYTFRNSQSSNLIQNLHQVMPISNNVLKQELETLARQLGEEETDSNAPLNFHLFTDNNKSIELNSDNSKFYNKSNETDIPEKVILNDESQSINEYKNNLVNKIVSDFPDSNETNKGPVNFTNLLDVL